MDNAPTHLYDAVQAPDGRLLLSAVGSFYWFDGAGFNPLPVPDDGAFSRSGVAGLQITRSGVIWADSYVKGLLRIDHGRVRSFGEKDGLPGAVNGLAEAADGSMWGAVAGALYHLRDERWYDESKSSGLPAGKLVSIYGDREGNLWALTPDSLYARPKGKAAFEQTPVHWGRDVDPQFMTESPDGGLWLGMVVFNTHTSIIRQLDVSGHRSARPRTLVLPYSLRDASFDRTGALWITGNGVRRIDVPLTSSAQPAQATPAAEILDSKELSSEETHGLCIDRQGNVWVTTLRGLDRLSQPVLIKLADHTVDPSGLPDLAAGNHGGVWIGSKGTQLLDARKGAETQIGPTADRYFCLYQSRDDTLWYTDREGLWMQKGEYRKQVKVPPGVEFISLRQVIDIPNHELVFLFQGSLWQYDGEHWSAISRPGGINDRTTLLFSDSAQHLRLGTQSGLIADLDSPFAPPLQTDLGTIQAALQTADGLVVTGDRGGVLVHQSKVIPLRFADDEISVAGTSGIVQSSNKDLWFNAGQGIVKVPFTEVDALLRESSHLVRARLLTEPDIHGPAPLLYDLPTAAVDAAGLLWFNTSDTVVHVDPSAVMERQILPTLTITSVMADGRVLADDERAPASTNTVRIAYLGADLSHPELVRYRYKLAGTDERWQPVGSRTEAVYTQLRPGTYQFEVIASNDGENWSPVAAREFSIEPSFYQTKSFLVACAVGICACGLFVYRLRIWFLVRGVRQQAEARANERLVIARDLHDTLLQGFQGVMLSIHVASQQVSAETRAHTLLEHALTKADQVIVSGRDRVAQLRSESMSTESLLESFATLINELQQQSGARLHLEIGGVPVELYQVVTSEFFSIGREAVLNATRHAEAKHIAVQLNFTPRYLQLICEDNGKGIRPSYLTSSRPGHFGLVGMRERAEQIGASFRCTSVVPTGTRIEVSLQARKAYQNSSSFWVLLQAAFSSAAANNIDRLRSLKSIHGKQ